MEQQFSSAPVRFLMALGLSLCLLSVHAVGEVVRSKQDQAPRNNREALQSVLNEITAQREQLKKDDRRLFGEQVFRLGSLRTKTSERAEQLLIRNIDRVSLLLLPHLKNDTRRIRERVCDIVVRRGRDRMLARVEPYFYDLLGDRRQDVRLCMLKAYLRVDPSAAVDRIMQSLSAGRSDDERFLALRVLARAKKQELSSERDRLVELRRLAAVEVEQYWFVKQLDILLGRLDDALGKGRAG